MNIIETVLGVPLGYVLYAAFLITGGFGMAIVIFAAISKLLLFPLIRLAHLNSIRLLKLQPALSAIKKRYNQDKERLNEEQYKLFGKERYSPLVGLVPLLAQLLLLVGMLQVMYDPLRHMRLPEGTDLRFLIFDLGVIPSLRNPSAELIIPLLSGLAALLFSLVQNSISPGALSQGKKTNLGLAVFNVGLSVYFAAVTPAGVGLYWTAGNLCAIAVAFALYQMYNPRKLAAEALAQQKAERKTPAEHKEEKERNKALRTRENDDAARFLAKKKQLVFYALSSGQYKYYKNTIEYLLEHSDIVIHYLTSDPDDAVFQQNSERLIPYFASQRKTIFLMLKLDADIMVTTVPDLQSYHMKRSVVRDDIEYIYTFHSPTSTSLIYKEKAFDTFNTVFCVGPHQVAELRRREELANLTRRKLVKTGYGLYDQLVESYAGILSVQNEKPLILIAPSWQADNILDICIDSMLEALLGQGRIVVVRPHPQYTRLFPERMEFLAKRYCRYVTDGELIFELDFSSNRSIFTSDVLITDWSGISYEFSYCTHRPCIYINTPMKIMNPNYEQYGLEVLDISLRDKVGVSIDVNDLGRLNEAVVDLLENKDSYKNQIEQTLKQYVYHPGRSGEAGGKYIIDRLTAKGNTGDV